LKKPDATNFSKKNLIHPFEDVSSLEFFAEKEDASLFVVGSHSKKRPNNLTFVRTFDRKVLDMVEVSVSNYRSCSEFKVTCLGMWVMVESGEYDGTETFNGVLWTPV
jgi:ribosome production factor 2